MKLICACNIYLFRSENLKNAEGVNVGLFVLVVLAIVTMLVAVMTFVVIRRKRSGELHYVSKVIYSDFIRVFLLSLILHLCEGFNEKTSIMENN